MRNQTIREKLQSFDALEHRLESVLNISGVEYINDSKATNVNATYYALECQHKPVVWIVGGVDKGNDYNELIGLVENKVKSIVALGVDNSKIMEAFGSITEVIEADSMKSAVRKAQNWPKKEMPYCSARAVHLLIFLKISKTVAINSKLKYAIYR